MPELISSQDHDKGERLKLVLNLTNVERPEAWEGWMIYEISLVADGDVLATSSHRTMMSDEIIRLCEVLEGSTQDEFEPMEPDFQLIFRPVKSQDVDEEYEVFVFINEAVRRREGFYSTDGLGLKLILDRPTCQEFTRQLRGQFTKLTTDVYRKQ